MAIEREIKIDTTAAQIAVEQLEQKVKDLEKAIASTFDNDERNALIDEFSEANKALNKLQDSIEGTAKETDKLSEASKDAGSGFGELSQIVKDSFGAGERFGEVVEDLTGGIVSQEAATKAFALAQKSLSAAFSLSSVAARAFAVALISTGIGAIIVLVGTLLAAFFGLRDEIENNGDEMRDWARDILDSLPFGEQLIELIDELNEKVGGLVGVWEAMKAAVVETIKSIGSAFAQFLDGNFEAALAILLTAPQVAANAAGEAAINEAERQQQEAFRESTRRLLEQKERELQILKASGEDTIALEREILELRLQTFESGSKDYEDAVADLAAFNVKVQREAAEEAQKIREEELEKEKEHAERTLALLTEYQERIRLARQEGAINELEAQQAILLELEALAEERFQKSLTDEEQELLAVQDKYFRLITLAEQQGLDTTALLEAQRQEEAAINEKYNQIEIQSNRLRYQNQLAIVRTGLSSISGLITSFAGDSERAQRRAFNINKAANIATATIDTILAAQKAYASQLIVGDPTSLLRAKLAAVFASVQGAARVAAIARTSFNSN